MPGRLPPDTAPRSACSTDNSTPATRRPRISANYAPSPAPSLPLGHFFLAQSSSPQSRFLRAEGTLKGDTSNVVSGGTQTTIYPTIGALVDLLSDFGPAAAQGEEAINSPAAVPATQPATQPPSRPPPAAQPSTQPPPKAAPPSAPKGANR